MVAHCAVIIIAHCALVPVPGDEDAILALWCEKTLQRIAMWQQPTDTRHWAPLTSPLLTSQQCRTRLQNLPARIANILVRSSSRHTRQHSNMILRSESTRAVLVSSSSSIKATSPWKELPMSLVPDSVSPCAGDQIRSGLGRGEELMVSINTIIRTLLRRGRGFYSRGSLGAYRWVNASNH